LILLFLFIENIFTVTFTDAINNLAILESYIKEYKKDKSVTDSETHLILSYIRAGRYSSSEWSIAGGTFPSDLDSYVQSKDSEKSTKAQEVRKYGEIELPSKEKIDFVHLFAVMNGINYGNSFTGGYSSLVGWGGDSAQLLKDIKGESGDLDKLIETVLSKYLGIKGQFGEADLVSDLDAPVILNNKKDSVSFADTIKSYYETNEYKNRYTNFVKLTFPDSTKDSLRNDAFNRYSKDSLINILECKYGVRDSGVFGCYLPGSILTQYKNHQKAAVYAFADCLLSKY
jgi:hypothetical protein